MWRWYTAEDRRQALLIGAMVVAMGVGVAAAVVVGAGMLAAWSAGSGLHLVGSGRWGTVLGGVVQTPAAPAAVFGLGGFTAVRYWLWAVLVGVPVLVGYGYVGRVMYGFLAPTGTGFATRAELAQELSATACRKRAKVTRPDLTRRGRFRAGPGQLGIPLHRAAVGGDTLWLPLENATGVIAPQQSGKSLMDLIHKILDAPAGLLVTSTKLDLFLLTAAARERAGSPVYVLDLTGQCRWFRRARWNPVAGCTTVKAAQRRADALVQATSGAAPGSANTAGSNHAFFERRAVDVMTSYLLAAGLSGGSVDDFVRWAQNDDDREAAEILRGYPEFAAQRRKLEQAQRVVEETRSGIWETLRDAVACLTDPESVATLLPRPGEPGLDVEALVQAGATVYVIGSDDDAAVQAPVVTAFVQEVLDTARRLALTESTTTGRERLSPPFTAVLDEIASICPLPDLPNTLSDSAGRGVLIHYALQSPAQAEVRWGTAADTMFDNTTALTVFGGMKSEKTLKWLSLLVGRRMEERRSRQSGRSWADAGSMSIGSERVDVLEPAAIRLLPRGRALVIMRSMGPLIVRLRPAWKRADWKRLQDDRARVRQGEWASGAPADPARRSAKTTQPVSLAGSS